MERNIGLLEIHGEAIGEKKEILDLLEEKIILTLKDSVLGLLLRIHGPRISEMKLNQKLKISSLRVN